MFKFHRSQAPDALQVPELAISFKNAKNLLIMKTIEKLSLQYKCSQKFLMYGQLRIHDSLDSAIWQEEKIEGKAAN